MKLLKKLRNDYMEINKVICDDCVNGLTRIEDNKVDLIYLD